MMIAPLYLSCKHFNFKKETCPVYPDEQADGENARLHPAREDKNCGECGYYEYMYKTTGEPSNQ
jgi:hypothetical protein